MTNFRRGVVELERHTTSDAFDIGFLPDVEKERIARSLLAEFGATHVKVAGAELIHGCLLPFKDHQDQEHNPTASLNFEKLTYNCFGCGAGGGLLWFVGVMRDTSGTVARRWLEDQVGVGGGEDLAQLLEFFDAIYSQERKVEKPMPHMNERILEPWMFIHPYMTEVRGISEETLMRFKVGYGEIKVRGTKSQRIVIPHFWRGDLVGWQTRRLFKDGTPKYLSSPDFPKDRSVYSYNGQSKKAVVVESPLSVLSKYHVTPYIEATFGAKVSDRQVKLLSMHPKVILFMDNDEAGLNATHRLAEALESYSAVYVAANPYAADPADLDDETYQRAVDEALPYSVWTPPERLEVWDDPRKTPTS